ncbi:hypothetical protein [Candidatus Finniella inopinata]|uniref:Uncharacterized protein n=1 Tax=Candidatus Finniella inopinata TaxID=1696036 RepID=A0A4Q7DES5_9PROT|nr:hypothetical protein [Candidatus Finniella inopinata]RZI45231.1 hypothetical protein EQU50_07830 [Candidatus Finniella inopinata]
MKRSLVLGGILLASAAAFKPVQASSALWEISASSLRRCYAPLRASLFSVPNRLFSSSEFRTGRYAQITEDVVFKRIMHKEAIRNSFLSAVLGQPVSPILKFWIRL